MHRLQRDLVRSLKLLYVLSYDMNRLALAEFAETNVKYEFAEGNVRFPSLSCTCSKTCSTNSTVYALFSLLVTRFVCQVSSFPGTFARGTKHLATSYDYGREDLKTQTCMYKSTIPATDSVLARQLSLILVLLRVICVRP